MYDDWDESEAERERREDAEQAAALTALYQEWEKTPLTIAEDWADRMDQLIEVSADSVGTILSEAHACGDAAGVGINSDWGNDEVLVSIDGQWAIEYREKHRYFVAVDPDDYIHDDDDDEDDDE